MTAPLVAALITGACTLLATYATWLFSRGYRRTSARASEAEENRLRAEGIMDRQAREIADKDDRLDRMARTIDALLAERGSGRAPRSPKP